MAEGLPAGYDDEVAEWRDIGARDQDAFEKWLKRYEGRLRGSLHSFAARVDVEAVIQEAVFRMWQRTGVVLPDGQRAIAPDGNPDFLYRWTARVARNDALNKQKRAMREEPLEQASEDGGPTSARAGKRIAEHEIHEDRRPDLMLAPRVRRCAQQLKGKQRDAILARQRDQGKRSDKDLAIELGLHYTTFRKQVERARDAVEECLQRDGINIREHIGSGRTKRSGKPTAEQEMLIAEATTAWRPRTPDGRILDHPAWADLDAAGRRSVFEDTSVMRVIEAALDPDGYSTTVRAVATAIVAQ